jgi:hypothetical protein
MKFSAAKNNLMDLKEEQMRLDNKNTVEEKRVSTKKQSSSDDSDH